MTIIQKAKNEFLSMLDRNYDKYNLRLHIQEAEKWLIYILKKYPEANKEILELTVWLHDIGQYPINEKIDHAITSEKIAEEFFKRQKCHQSTIKEVLHCIRSHRNKDVKPQSLEAKLFCALDSISHFTYAPHIDMLRNGRGKEGLEKLERDYHDLDGFPEIKKELTPIYRSWKSLLLNLIKLDIR